MPVNALSVFLIYVLPFVVIGLLTQKWVRRRGVDLRDVQAQAGSGRGKRRLFLLGIWRTEE